MRLKQLYERYRDHVEFIVVYVKEAHATDRWWLGRTRTQRVLHRISGNRNRLDIKEPVSDEQRRKVAASCFAELFDGVVPLYVDTIDDATARTYTARPTRIYFIGRDGRVVYNPGLGPYGFNPAYLEPVIRDYLQTHEAGSASAASSARDS